MSAPYQPRGEIDRPLNPMSDAFIKFLLGRPENSDLLMDLINAVFADTGRPLLRTVEILNPYHLRDLQDQKEIFLDVKADDTEGRLINVEVQTYSDPEYLKRTLYYWAAAYYRQMEKGEIYRELSSVAVISLLDFPVLEGLDDYHSLYQVLNREYPGFCLTEDLELHFVEVPKLLSQLAAGRCRLDDKLVSWCYYLSYEGDEKAMKVILDKNKELIKAHRSYKEFTGDRKALEMARNRDRFQRTWRSLMAYYRQEGKEEGHQEGQQEGRKEAARRMKAKGYPLQDIREITGLSEEEIQGL